MSGWARGRGAIAASVAAAALVAASMVPRVASAQTQAGKTAALDDPTIVAIFDAANTWDIATGGMAAKKGTTKEIRDFGAQLVRDHTAVRQQARDLAKKLGVTPTPPAHFAMAAENAAAVAKLRSVKGVAFDRAFLEHEVAFHKEVLDATSSTLLPALQNQQVKNLVLQVAPAFQAHMAMAQHLLDKMGN
jgi:putative membrane protein